MKWILGFFNVVLAFRAFYIAANNNGAEPVGAGTQYAGGVFILLIGLAVMYSAWKDRKLGKPDPKARKSEEAV